MLFLLLLIIFLVFIYRLLKKAEFIKRSGFSLAIFAGVLIIFLAGTATLTSQPSFCRLCHKVNQPKGHASLACYSCHGESGSLAPISQKLREFRMFTTFVTKFLSRSEYFKPIVVINNTRCLRCHANIRKEVTVRREIRVSHREFIDKSTCYKCHQGVAHKKREVFFSVMQECSFCHNNRTVAANCEICHVNKVTRKSPLTAKSGIEHDANWLKIHGMYSDGVCSTCHKEEDCQKCHVSMPHPDGWAYLHGSEASGQLAQRERSKPWQPDSYVLRKEFGGKTKTSFKKARESIEKNCARCHLGEKLCNDCHTTQMPHPEKWLPKHAREMKRLREKTCLTCHVARDCDFCHVKHIHPPALGLEPGEEAVK
jgi:hypothetical protein